MKECFRRGLLVLGAGRNAIRLCPPLVLTKEQADIALGILDRSADGTKITITRTSNARKRSRVLRLFVPFVAGYGRRDMPDRTCDPHAGMAIDKRQELGKSGEDLACAELERRGYAILERRYRTRFGEIDIIASDRGRSCSWR